MYLSTSVIGEALEQLENVHPVYGVTFLVCKQNNLPIGSSINFPINAKEKEFLDYYYKPASFSKYYYRVFRPSDKAKEWVDAKKYASSTIQAIRTQTFRDVFEHPTKTEWGWANDYIKKCKYHLQRLQSPSIQRSVWLFGYLEKEIGLHQQLGKIL